MRKILTLFMLLCLIGLIFTGCAEETMSDGENEPFVFKGEVVELGESLSVEMEESEFSSGLYHVLTSEQTLYFDENGTPLSRDDVKVGSVIEISFSGQVMLSYPPKIAAKSIKILS